MKKTAGNNQGPGAWILGSMASLMVAMSALGQYSVTQPAAITINDNSPASPYPTTIHVSGLQGGLEKVTVTLNNLNHQYANDIGVLMVETNSGQKFLLMNNAGGGQPVRGANVTFDPQASSFIPQFSALTSGSFKPANYGSATSDFFPPAPPHPYSTDLTTATAPSGNGDWQLWVQDDSSLYSGTIDSWTLSVYTFPIVSVTNATLTIDENHSGTFYFNVKSSSTNVDNLIYSASASPNLATNFVFGGSGTNRFVVITPVTNTFGAATVTITVSDGVGAPVPQSVALTINHINQPPLISLNTNSLTTIAGVITTNVIATISDPDPSTTLTLNFASDNTNVVSPSGVIVNGNNFAVLPAGNAVGSANLTVWVSDGTLKTTNTFPVAVTVNPTGPQLLYGNSNRITVTADSHTSSTINVANVPGRIAKLTVALEGLPLAEPVNLGAILDGPHGQQVVLNFPGPAGPLTYGEVTLSDAGNDALPGISTLTNVILKATPGTLASTIGSDPNGLWTLTVYNSAASDKQVSAGWLMNIYSGPTITGLSNSITMPEESTTNVIFAVAGVNGATVTNISAFAANTSLLAVATNLNGNTGTLTLTGKSLQYGATTVDVVAKDNNGFSATNQVAVTVTFVNHAPVLGLILKQNTRPAVPITVPITVTDPDLPAQGLTVTARSDNQTLLPDSNILISPVTATDVSSRFISLFPLGIVSDTANVTVTVSDGITNSSQSFVFFVDVAGNPLYAGGAVTINGAALPAPGASPYPSTISVTGLTGAVAEVQVTLSQISQTTADFNAVSAMLVGPAGQKVVLVSGAGGANTLTSTTLVFADGGAVLPQNTRFISGTYQPVDYSNGTAPFPAPAPAPPSPPNLLGTFVGTDPNGTWRLYVLDNAANSHGTIRSWTLSIRTQPNVAPIAAQTVNENGTLRLTVTVGDNQPGVNLTVTATPSDTTLIQPISVSGSGATRTLQITPFPYKTNSSPLTVLVVATDPNGHSSQQSFGLTIQAVNLPPVLSSISAQSTPAATVLGPVNFTVWDPQNSALTVVGASSDKNLVPDANIGVTLTGTSNGTNSYALNLLPGGVLTGTSTITVTATDGVGQRNSTSFALTVTPNVAFGNTTVISIPEGLPIAGTANPYPSTVTVSNVGGVVSSISAALVGLNHPFPQDLDVLLVGPNNKSVMLMAHAGGGNPASGLRLTFSDDPANPFIPFNAALATTTYRPTNYAGSFSMPGAPASPYSTNLAAFAGINPNGNWSLYVLDDTYPQGGSISGGWILYIQTAPVIGAIGPQSTVENAPVLVPIVLSDSSVNLSNLIVTATSTTNFPTGLVPNDATHLKLGGFGGNRTLLITPGANLPSTVTNVDGASVISVTVTDPAGPTATTSFPLTVRYVNQAPAVTVASPALTNQVMNVVQNTPTNIVFNVGDVDSALSTNGITVTSSDQSIVAASGIVVTKTNIPAGGAGTVIVNINPVINAPGTTTLSFNASDGVNTTITNLTLNVLHVHQPPTILLSSTNRQFNIPAASQTTNIAFTVGSVEVPPGSLVVTASSSNPGVVPNSPYNIVLGGDSGSRTIRLIPIGVQQGDSTITLTVSDTSVTPALTATTNFILSVQAPTAAAFANTSAITIKGTNAAPFLTVPYPSVITVAGLIGNVFKATVVLQGFSNTSPANLDILLVSPSGTNAMLMSGAGGNNAVGNLRVEFEDGAPLIPNSGPLVSGTYHPANYTSNVLPGPAPAGPYLSRMSVFSGVNPNGDWKLYINDRVTGDFGAIQQGWTLTLQTTPTIAVTSTTPNPLNFPENSSATVGLTVSDPLTTVADFTSLSDNPRLLAPSNVVYSAGVGAGNFIATLNPAFLQFGTNNFVIIVTRNGASASTTNIAMFVSEVNVPPSVTRLPNLSSPENVQTNIQFLVADPDTPLAGLTIRADSGTPAVIGNSNLVFVGSTNNVLNGVPGGGLVQLNMLPNTNAIGASTIVFTITDPKTIPNGTNVVTTNFVFTVFTVTYPPTISSIATQSVVAGAITAPINFSVNSVNVPAPALTVTGTSSDQSLVRSTNIVVTGSPGIPTAGPVPMTVTVRAEPGVQGPVFITLRVAASDGSGSTSTTFTLNILPTREHVFTSSGVIQIPISGAGTPYPSTIDATNLQGVISKVRVSVSGFAHTFPSDVGIMVASPGPNGTNVVLMNNAGTAQAGPTVTNLSFVFDQSAPNTLPQGTLISGTYKPADYKAGGYNFPTPAPGGPYSSPSLNFFNNHGPNGTWSLYVADFTPPDAGVINGGWSVAITTQPTIDGLVNVTNDENVIVRQNFTVADDSPGIPVYNWSGVSTDQNVVRNTNIVVTGSGTSYTVTVTPNANAFGITTNTISGVNGYGQTVTATFVTKFNFVNQPPFILPVPLPPQSVSAGAVVSVPLNYGDPGIPSDQLIVTFDSSDKNLVPVSNIKLIGTNIMIGPAGVQPGTSTITVRVAQPASVGGLSTNASFVLTVLKSPIGLGANTNSIAINNNAAGTPYPSTINVSGVAGTVVNVSVSFVGLQHPFPSDISALLVGPQGQKVVVMSRAGDGAAISNVRLAFDDLATAFLPQAQLTDGTYKPTDYKTTDTFFAPAPAGPYSRALNAFAGTNPNGTWSLYVQDDVNPDSGVMAGGWVLNIVTTAPIIQGVPPQTTPENTPLSVPITVGSGVTAPTNLNVTATHNGDSPSGLVSTLAINGTGANRTLVITPGANLPSSVQTADGTSIITVTVIDGATTSSTQFPLTVKYVNQPPSITGLNDQTTPANQILTVPFTIGDPDNAIDTLLISSTNSNPSVGSVVVTGSGATQKLIFTPTGVTGLTIASVSVSDGNHTTTSNLNITVTTPAPPVLGPIPDTNTTVNVSAIVPLNVSDGLTPISSLSYSATATGANPNLITGVSFNVSGTNATATIRVGQNQLGSAVVTITVADANLATSSQSFTLTVNPNPPVLAPIPDQTTPLNTPVTIRLGITAGDVPISNLNFSATSTPLGLSPQLVSGVAFTFDGVNEFATISVVTNVAGTNDVSILVYDGFSTVSQSFDLTVKAKAPPVLGPIADQTTAKNTPVTIALTVTSPDTAITNLSFSAASTNLDLVRGVTFSYSGGVESATVNLVSNETGVAYITINVTDGINPPSEQTFKLTVNEEVGPTLTATVAGNQFTISWTGAPNAEYEVQSTTDFATWTDVASVTADATGAAHYTTTISGNGGKFYRVLLK